MKLLNSSMLQEEQREMLAQTCYALRGHLLNGEKDGDISLPVEQPDGDAMQANEGAESKGSSWEKGHFSLVRVCGPKKKE